MVKCQDVLFAWKGTIMKQRLSFALSVAKIAFYVMMMSANSAILGTP